MSCRRPTPALKFAVSFVTAGLVFSAAPPSHARDAPRVDVAGLVGTNYSVLTRPNDPAGEPTLLNGSAFTGFGFTLGASGSYPLGSVAGGELRLRADALISQHSGTGFAELGVEKRTVEISGWMFRLPIGLSLSSRFGKKTRLHLLVGPEVLVGMTSSATVTEENLPTPAKGLETTPVTHVGLTAGIGLVYDLGSLRVPVEIRGTWDPMVGASTVERFSAFADPDQPGQYQVAFDRQILVLVGLGKVIQ